jgi:hypothetical protein
MTDSWNDKPPAGAPDVSSAQDVRALAGQDAVERVKHELGIGVPRARFRPGGLHPDTSGLAEGLGLK